MRTYLVLYKWNEDEIKTIKYTPQRIERARKSIESVGGELQAGYFTFGKCDVVPIVEAPSDEANAKA